VSTDADKRGGRNWFVLIKGGKSQSGPGNQNLKVRGGNQKSVPLKYGGEIRNRGKNPERGGGMEDPKRGLSNRIEFEVQGE